MRTAWLVALVLLAGCATTDSSSKWTKAGASEEQSQRDRDDCLMQARQMVPGADGPRMRLDSARYDRCMGDRGYTMAPK